MGPKAPKPEFAEPERALDEILSKLKGTRDPNQRRELLRDMRLLLSAADRVVESPAPP